MPLSFQENPLIYRQESQTDIEMWDVSFGPVLRTCHAQGTWVRRASECTPVPNDRKVGLSMCFWYFASLPLPAFKATRTVYIKLVTTLNSTSHSLSLRALFREWVMRTLPYGEWRISCWRTSHRAVGSTDVSGSTYDTCTQVSSVAPGISRLPTSIYICNIPILYQYQYPNTHHGL